MGPVLTPTEQAIQHKGVVLVAELAQLKSDNPRQESAQLMAPYLDRIKTLLDEVVKTSTKPITKQRVWHNFRLMCIRDMDLRHPVIDWMYTNDADRAIF